MTNITGLMIGGIIMPYQEDLGIGYAPDTDLLVKMTKSEYDMVSNILEVDKNKDGVFSICVSGINMTNGPASKCHTCGHGKTFECKKDLIVRIGNNQKTIKNATISKCKNCLSIFINFKEFSV